MAVSVAPRLVPYNNLLAKVDDVFNGVLINGNAVDDVLFIGRGAGMMPTASAVVADIIDIAGRPEIKNQIWAKAEDTDLAPSAEMTAKYYVCVKNALNEDKVKEVFGEISQILLRDGELSFITQPMKKWELEEKVAKLDVVSALEIL